MQLLTRLAWGAVLAPALFGQLEESAARFTAADVHVSAPLRNPNLRGPFLRAGVYEIRQADMLDLISTAYGLHSNLVSGGPSWLEMDRYDVIARPPEKASPESLRNMLLQLLRERFQLAAHQDTRSMPAFALTAGKHPALKRSQAEGSTGCKLSAPAQTPGQPSPAGPQLWFECHGLTMQAFAGELPNNLGANRFFNNSPVVDRTGLEGAWDFNLHFSMNGGAAESLTIFDAVDKQLGLKLDATTAPVPVLIVDKVNRTPSDNPPGTRAALQLGPLPTEFEVANIKPTDPSYHEMDFRLLPSGQINARGLTLKFLINQAWDLPNYMIVGAPAWMDEDRYDIVAKAPRAAMIYEPGSQEPDLDDDAVKPMLQALLADRFGLVTHLEDRPAEAYTLIAVKPKLKPADPGERTRFHEGPPAPNARDPRTANPALNRFVTCQNMSMAQFADQLQRIAGGYIHAPVLDKTGIEGGFDFTLSFSGAGVLRNGRGGRGGRGGDAPAPGSSDPALAAPDPSGGISLFDAIEKQLGLKMVKENRPVSMLVIDKVNRKPTDN